MDTIDLSNEAVPNRVGSGSLHSHVVRAEKTRNGNIEITRTEGGDTRNVLTVIPKEKRAELAQFLVSND